MVPDKKTSVSLCTCCESSQYCPAFAWCLRLSETVPVPDIELLLIETAAFGVVRAHINVMPVVDLHVQTDAVIPPASSGILRFTGGAVGGVVGLAG